MSDLEFKIIEQATEIADGDYILTVHNGEIKKVAKADANIGSGDGIEIITLSWDSSISGFRISGDNSNTIAELFNKYDFKRCVLYDGQYLSYCQVCFHPADNVYVVEFYSGINGCTYTINSDATISYSFDAD